MHRAAARVTAVFMYLCYAAAGIVSFVAPTQTVESRVAWGVYLWASMFAAGGLVAAYGAWRRQWVTERTALYPLLVANGVYALSLFARYATSPRPVILFLGFLFAALVGSLTVRHTELTRISRGSARREKP